ncbi:ATPase, T2SS/T4P/T4SS family [Methylacidimicrobium sp. B4]|uniref:ATPase, T2SS/T4P/T4SS family n=1 Tax=Methylacidimicrobium sp. B4 TaxID=2796139 RepID=UPI001A8FE760|nr:ATPase, T2SS/T4P/T4SS family [Methylacidimicrobium sp. B4]QSR84012.1 Flp pilus assembly complex ATPase component TadA [Methylacidimicrobium sp. B4]
MPTVEDSGNERILATAIGHRWLEEARLPAIRAALATLPEANAADLLHEQGLIDSTQRAWLRRQETSEPHGAPGEPFVDQCLREAALQGCSDLHLAPNHPPLCRRQGRLRSLGGGWSALSVRHIAEIVERTLPACGREALARQGWASLPYAGGRLRTRLTVGRDATGYFLSFRLLFPHAPELRDLGMEEAMPLATIPSGLILVAGGSGQGKSTLLAALARQVRRSRPGRVVILEDLPEHAWEDDPPRPVRIAFAELHGERDEVLRAAFAMDPDVLLLDVSVGPSTLPLLVEETARSGALVMATLGLRGVAEVLRSLCAEMPQEASRSLLVRTLRAIIALELVPGATGKERVAATELFRNVPAAAASLTSARPERIESVLDVGEGRHFQPIDDSLWRLFQESRITMEAAYARARYRPRWVARMHAPDYPGVL